MTNAEQTKWDTDETCGACGSSISVAAEPGGALSVECDCGRAEALAA